MGLLLIPGLIHDYAYKYDQLLTRNEEGVEVSYNKNVGRRFWNQLFRDVAIDVIGLRIINHIAWFALFLFGFMAWNKHREADSSPLRDEYDKK